MPEDAWPRVVFRPLLAGFAGLMDHHRALLDDQVRTSAFLHAIEAQVSDGAVVADLGAGIGILSLAAARAGARRVYAIEHAPVAELAREVIAANGMADRIELIHRHSRDAQLDAPVDLLVSECLGILGLGSTMIPWLGELRERVLAPGGAVIPRSVSVLVAGVEGAALSRYAQPFSRAYGFDVSTLNRSSAHNLYNVAVEPEALLTEPACVTSVDLESGVWSGDAEGQARATVSRSGELAGLVGFFEADLGAGHTLSTAPSEPSTVWRQVFLPLEPRAVSEGQTLDLTVSFARHPTRVVDIGWGARVGDAPWQHRNTQRSHPSGGAD